MPAFPDKSSATIDDQWPAITHGPRTRASVFINTIADFCGTTAFSTNMLASVDTERSAMSRAAMALGARPDSPCQIAAVLARMGGDAFLVHWGWAVLVPREAHRWQLVQLPDIMMPDDMPNWNTRTSQDPLGWGYGTYHNPGTYITEPWKWFKGASVMC